MVDLSKLFGKEQQSLHFDENYLQSFVHFAVDWDSRAKSSNLNLTFDDDQLSGGIITSETSLNSFKTVYASEPFAANTRHYFAIKFLKGCNFKIGISKSNTEVEVAFCDALDGYGLYSAGCLRNGSKTTGRKYAQAFRGTKDQDVIGVYVDTIDGRVFFSKNGEVFETAYQGPELRNQEFYAACSCLTKEESFELLYPQPED